MSEFFKKNALLSADDFGISQEANDRIMELLNLNKLSRIAVMIDGLISQKEKKQLLESKIKLDLHLDLDGLKSKQADRQYPESALSRLFSFLQLYLLGQLSAKTSEIIWEKQLAKFELIFGKKPDGLNSHQHIHFFPPYFKVFLSLCQKHRIGYLRLGKQSYKKCFNLICYILDVLRIKNIKKFLSSELETSDFLVSLDWIKDMESFESQAMPGTIEIVCHPERIAELAKIKKYF